MATNQHRLPTDVRPVSYDLTLTPNIENFTFTGKESIKVLVEKPANSVVINAIDLNIANASATLKDGKKLKAEVSLDKDAETATLSFGQILPAGDATLDLEFDGTLND